MSGRLAAVGAETVRIVDEGGYRAGDGTWVDLAADVAAAAGGTRLYLPEDELPAAPAGRAPPPPPAGGPQIEVTYESTLVAAARLGDDVASLVFASARNPGGGFLGGAKSQEEDLARASALYACQRTQPDFYAHHRADHDLRYSHRIIYSPGVPVFRDDRGALLARPFHTAMITAAAPNLGAIARNQPDNAAGVPAVLRERAARVLRVAAAHGHRTLVLGAWGCGVFRNDPATVADAFARALSTVNAFDRVVFGILDRVAGTPVHRAFVDRFAGPDAA